MNKKLFIVIAIIIFIIIIGLFLIMSISGSSSTSALTPSNSLSSNSNNISSSSTPSSSTKVFIGAAMSDSAIKGICPTYCPSLGSGWQWNGNWSISNNASYCECDKN